MILTLFPARRRPLPLLSALFALFVVGPAALAASERPSPDLAAMTRRAGVVVAGEIVRVRPGAHPRHPRLGVTFVTLRVSEAFKGARPGLFTFMQIGHAGDAPPPAGGPRFMLIPDLPTYRPGEEVLLFLYPATETGLTSPVDGRRGKWRLFHDPRDGERPVRVRVPEGGGNTPYASVRGRLRAAVSAAPEGKKR